MPEQPSTFVDRFAVFYDSCSAEERDVLAMLGTAAMIVRDGTADEHDVSGFQLDAGSPMQAVLRESQLVQDLLNRLAAMREEQAMAIVDNHTG